MTHDTDLTIEATGLGKSYNSTPVVAGIDLRVPSASVFALLGPNGAGKTTTVRMLATLTAPDRGVALVAGSDVVAQRAEVRRRIGLTGQYAAAAVAWSLGIIVVSVLCSGVLFGRRTA